MTTVNSANDDKSKITHQFFENVAESYDFMNDVSSVGYHRWWRSTFIQRVDPTRGMKYLDMAGGTGDLTFRILRALQNVPSGGEKTEVTVCDISQQMIDFGKRRAEKLDYVEGKLQGININWVCANGENLPFDDNSFDVYIIGFGIRHCIQIDKVLSEAFRVLKKGGRFLCLEFGHMNNKILQWMVDKYLFNVLPRVGRLITGNLAPYYYFAESVKKCPTQEDIKLMIEKARFDSVHYENLTFGIVAIHSGFKST